jgi:hypothetical protein
MTISVRNSADDPTIVCWTITGRWTWQHLEAAVNQTHGRAEDGRLDLIINVQKMGLPPANVATMVRTLPKKYFQVSGLNVVIGADYYLKLLWRYMSPALPMERRLYFADSIAEAHAYIHADRGLATPDSENHAMMAVPEELRNQHQRDFDNQPRY